MSPNHVDCIFSTLSLLDFLAAKHRCTAAVKFGERLWWKASYILESCGQDDPLRKNVVRDDFCQFWLQVLSVVYVSNSVIHSTCWVARQWQRLCGDTCWLMLHRTLWWPQNHRVMTFAIFKIMEEKLSRQKLQCIYYRFNFTLQKWVIKQYWATWVYWTWKCCLSDRSSIDWCDIK